MKIVELVIEDLEHLGFDQVALVENPAIESGFHAFSEQDIESFITEEIIKTEMSKIVEDEKKFNRVIEIDGTLAFDNIKDAEIYAAGIGCEGYHEHTYDGETYYMPCKTHDDPAILALKEEYKQAFASYDDYPQAASDNAARAVKYAEENGWGRCGTAVGKIRAHQLANREPISEETIARMAAFERHRRNSKTPYGEGCGKLMWDAWGGNEGIAWAQRKLRQIREDFSKQNFSFPDAEEKMVVGPLMIPDKLIFRVDENMDPYYVYFSKDTIASIAEKMMREKRLDIVNIEHDQERPVEGFMTQTWIVEDPATDTSKNYGLDLPAGTWVGMYKIDDPEAWKMVKDGYITGFSIEGFFADKLIQE